jgi:glycerol-3-phosphate dehydrogenase (NAD(P)+)
MNVGVIGAGSWGTALALVLARKGFTVKIWSHTQGVADEINIGRENASYLPGHTIPDNLSATSDLEEVCRYQDMMVLVAPSHVTRDVMTDAAPYLREHIPIVSATKGIENDTLETIHEVLEDVLPFRYHPYLSYLSGPSFAKEVAEGVPTAVVIAAYGEKLAMAVQHAFNTPLFRCYRTNDVVGVEIGGSLKNVIAIAAGAADGMGFGHNARAGLITRGLAEISRMAVARGANPLTLAGLAGMGDLVLTCTGGLSRNRTVGTQLGQGRDIDDILADMKMVAEGVKTAKSVHDLAAKMHVEMPICESVYQVIYEKKSPHQALVDLMSRELKRESFGF